MIANTPLWVCGCRRSRHRLHGIGNCYYSAMHDCTRNVVARRASYFEKVFVKLIFDSMSAKLMSQSEMHALLAQLDVSRVRRCQRAPRVLGVKRRPMRLHEVGLSVMSMQRLCWTKHGRLLSGFTMIPPTANHNNNNTRNDMMQKLSVL